MAGNGAPARANPFGFGMPQPAAAADPNPAEQEGFNPPRPFLDPIQPWIEQHKDQLQDLGVHRYDQPAGPMPMTATQLVVLGLLKRVTDLERQMDNMDRAMMQQRNPNARGGRTRRRHTRVLGLH